MLKQVKKKYFEETFYHNLGDSLNTWKLLNESTFRKEVKMDFQQRFKLTE